MDYREIVAVTGMGGLYQLLTSKNDGAIVRALADGKTVFVSARKHQLTPLESIEIYTTGENVRLHNVLQQMQEQEGTTPLPDTKDVKAIQAYFSTVFPQYDESRVYASDLKKMVRWYSLLKDAELLDFSRYTESEEGEESDSPMEEEAPMPLEGQVQVKESKKDAVSNDEAASQSVEGGNAEEVSDAPPAKKTRAKKTAPETTGEEAGEEGAPAKKPRAKKAAADTDATGEEAAPKKTTRKQKSDDAGE
jgi:hypothetical protein